MASAFKRRLIDIPGYAGGNLQDQLDEGKAAFQPSEPFEETRPREVAPQLPGDMVADSNATRSRAVSFDPQTGKPNEDFYRDKGDVSGLYNAEQNWQPHGAKRGFKNSLKTGIMYASDAIKAHPEDPVTAAIAGFGTGAIGGTAAPNFKNRLTREWNLSKTGGELQNQIKLQGEQAKIDSLQSKPRIQQAAQDEREINNALSQYNRLESYDPDDPADAGLKAYFKGRGLELKKKLKGSNQIAVWKNGQLLIVDKPSAEARGATVGGENVTDAGRTPNAEGLTPNQQEVTDRDTANRGSREAQFKSAEKGRNDRANARNEQSERNATIVAGGQVARMGDPTVHQTNIAEIDQDIAQLDEQIKTLTEKRQAGGLTSSEGEALNASQREKKGLERERRDEREKLGKIESAQNAPTQRRDGRGQPSGNSATKGSFNLGAWKTAHPEATKERIQAQRSKAKARQLSIVE